MDILVNRAEFVRATKMTDIYSVEKRSEIMSRVRSRNNSLELAVRSKLHRAGFRFSLHRKDLPGTPDVVLRKYRVVVFVHGCFWHQHQGCSHASLPAQNVAFWASKLEGNKRRDSRVSRLLRSDGWHVITVWECEQKNGFARLLRTMTRLAS